MLLEVGRPTPWEATTMANPLLTDIGEIVLAIACLAVLVWFVRRRVRSQRKGHWAAEGTMEVDYGALRGSATAEDVTKLSHALKPNPCLNRSACNEKGLGPGGATVGPLLLARRRLAHGV